MGNKKIISPRIKRLAEDLLKGKKQALNEFWEELEANSAPLIENIEGDDENYLVTLIWRDRERLKNISVLGEIFGGPFGDGTEDISLEKLLDTNLWFRTNKVRKDVYSLYLFVVNHPENEDDWDWDDLDLRVDPLNKKTYKCPTDEEYPDECALIRSVESVVQLPYASKKYWSTERENVPKGKLEMFRFESEILNNKRRIWVYTPHGYSNENSEYGLAVFTDGWEYINLINANNTFDNLISENKIPPMCAVFIESLENRDEELNCNDKFLDFLNNEILSWINKEYNITKDASKNIMVGLSFGGLTAAYVGLKNSDTFGKILCQSGGFHGDSDDESGEGLIIKKYENNEKLPLDFYLDLGTYEVYPPIRNGNKLMLKVLKEKGYNVQYQEFPGAHCYVYWEDTLPEALIWLAGNKE